MNILDNLCRSCNIEKGNLLNIHDKQEPSIFIKSMLEYCLQTTLTKESKFPRFICYDCLKQLEISYRFIKRFHLSHREFEESDNCLQTCYGELNSVHTSAIHYDENFKKSSKDTLEDLKTNNNAPNKDSKYSISGCPIGTGNFTEICSLCNKTFFTKKALNLHTKLSHKRKAEDV